jgi:hypothetical protein
MGLLADIAGLAGGAVDLMKAQEVGKDPGIEPGRGPGAALVADPYVWGIAEMTYKEKPASVNYRVLRYLCQRDAVLASIVLTRLRQLKSFARVRTHEEAEKTTTTGFRVRLKAGAGGRTQEAVNLENHYNHFIARCARADVAPYEHSFGSFLVRFAKDRLEIDQATAEIRLDAKGRAIEFFAIDGATIRTVDPAKVEAGDKTAYIQLYQNVVRAKFTEDELMFCPENVCTALEWAGYGCSETEIALKMVMAHLGIDETNSRQFHPGSMPKGLMTVSGAEMSEAQLQVLETRWRNQVANYRGKHRIPFLPIPRGAQMQFLHLPQATDIEFGRFLDYLVNLLTALYGMDPSEINFPNRAGSIGNSQPAFVQSAPESARLTASKDKGLRTLLAFIEDCLNSELLPLVDVTGDFEFSFVGFDRATEKDRLDQDEQRSRTFMTINEVRKMRGLDAVKGGDVIRDSIWMQGITNEQQRQDQARQAAQQQAQMLQSTTQATGAPPEGELQSSQGAEEWDSSTTRGLTREENTEGSLW